MTDQDSALQRFIRQCLHWADSIEDAVRRGDSEVAESDAVKLRTYLERVADDLGVDRRPPLRVVQ